MRRRELVREAMRMSGLSNGVEVTMLADIPSEGSGLGSSSSLTVGVLNAFHMYEGRQVTAEQLAREACQIEIDICGKPIGKQDQYIAAYGGVHEYQYRQDGSVGVRRIRLSSADMRRLGSELMLFYTDITRRSAEILNEQRSQTVANVDYLRQIKHGVPQVINAMERRRLDLIGDVLHHSWTLKKKLANNISSRTIDEMYEVSLSAGATLS